MKRSKIDGNNIAGCGDDSGSFGKLLDQQFHDEVPDQKMSDLIEDCFVALTGYLSAAVSQVSVESVICLSAACLLVAREVILSIPATRVYSKVALRLVHYL